MSVAKKGGHCAAQQPPQQVPGNTSAPQPWDGQEPALPGPLHKGQTLLSSATIRMNRDNDNSCDKQVQSAHRNITGAGEMAFTRAARGGAGISGNLPQGLRPNGAVAEPVGQVHAGPAAEPQPWAQGLQGEVGPFPNQGSSHSHRDGSGPGSTGPRVSSGQECTAGTARVPKAAPTDSSRALTACTLTMTRLWGQ